MAEVGDPGQFLFELGHLAVEHLRVHSAVGHAFVGLATLGLDTRPLQETAHVAIGRPARQGG